MPIKSFRGKVDNDEIIRVRLSTNRGDIGYSVRKFQAIPVSPKTATEEAIIYLFKTKAAAESASGTGTVDFTDSLLLGVLYYSQSASSTIYPEDILIIFDREIVNQDLYILCSKSSGEPINYYLELEPSKLDGNAQSVATLRDLRANTA